MDVTWWNWRANCLEVKKRKAASYPSHLHPKGDFKLPPTSCECSRGGGTRMETTSTTIWDKGAKGLIRHRPQGDDNARWHDDATHMLTSCAWHTHGANSIWAPPFINGQWRKANLPMDPEPVIKAAIPHKYRSNSPYTDKHEYLCIFILIAKTEKKSRYLSCAQTQHNTRFTYFEQSVNVL